MAHDTRSVIRSATDISEQLSVVLSKPRSQHVLGILADADRRLSFDELAFRVAAREAENADDGSLTSSLEDVEVSLHHHHLPTLSDSGIVAYDHREGDVALTEAGMDCVQLLDIYRSEL